jgi:membrane associated rhomboid family serine protease
MTLIPSLGASGAIFGLMAVYAILYSGNRFYLPSASGMRMRRVSAGYFIITYFIAELSYAMYSLYDPFSLGSTAHFAHVGGFIAGAIIAGIFRAVKGKSYNKKLDAHSDTKEVNGKTYKKKKKRNRKKRSKM